MSNKFKTGNVSGEKVQQLRERENVEEESESDWNANRAVVNELLLQRGRMTILEINPVLFYVERHVFLKHNDRTTDFDFQPYMSGPCATGLERVTEWIGERSKTELTRYGSGFDTAIVDCYYGDTSCGYFETYPSDTPDRIADALYEIRDATREDIIQANKDTSMFKRTSYGNVIEFAAEYWDEVNQSDD